MIRYLFLMMLSFSVSATDINLTWNTPTELTDGTEIITLDGFTIYHTPNNGNQITYKAGANDNSFKVLNVEEGIHTFVMSATESGQEGLKTDPISKKVSRSKVITFTVIIEVID